MLDPIRHYKDLIVWKKAMDLVELIYTQTKKYPSEELYVLSSQSRKSAISIPSNIAEGYRRNTKKEYRRFIEIAFGSAAELETQIEIAKRLGYLETKTHQEITNLLTEILKILNTLMQKLK